jgi:hypothetical protein
MVHSRRLRQVSSTRDGLHGPNVNGVFLHGSAADAVPVDVVPGFRCVEGELVGHYSDYGTVLVVVEFVVEGDAAAE